MTLFLATFFLVVLAMAAMGLGVLLGRKRRLVRGCGRECECLRRNKQNEECQQ